MSTSHSGYSFPGASGGGYSAPSASSPSASTPRVICPGEGTRFPPLDDHLVPVGTRAKVLDGVRMETMAADPPHALSHADLAYVLRPLVPLGYRVTVDMQTRYSTGDNFAPDISILRDGTNPDTGERFLEEVAFEIGNTQRLSDLQVQAAKMARRGVRCIVALLVPQKEAFLWSAEQGLLVQMADDAVVSDPALVHPLPVSLLLLIARGAVGLAAGQEVKAAVDNFVAEALVAQDNPVIKRVRADEARQGELRGEQRGELRGVAQTLLRTLDRRGVAVDELSQRRILTCHDLPTLQRWMDNAITAPTIADVFG